MLRLCMLLSVCHCCWSLLCHDANVRQLQTQTTSCQTSGLQGHGPSGQRPTTTFIPLPQSALSGSHGQRRQARGPNFVALSSSPVPSSSSRSKNQPVLTNQPSQPHAAGTETPTSTSSNVNAVQTAPVFCKCYINIFPCTHANLRFPQRINLSCQKQAWLMMLL